MNTAFMLMAKYDGNPLIDIEDVRRDFFSELSLATFVRRLDSRDIPLPYVRMNATQKGRKTISLADLASFIDERIKVSKREMAN